MKKFIMCCLVLLLCLVGCSSNKSELKRQELDNDEMKMLQLFGSNTAFNYHILEFNTPENIGMILVKYYHLEKDKWEEIDRNETILNREESVSGRIGFEFDRDSMIKCNVEIGNAIYRHDVRMENLMFDASVFGNEFFKGSQEIELNKEIPISIVQYSFDGKVYVLPLNFFKNPEEKEGMNSIGAITINFVQQR